MIVSESLADNTCSAEDGDCYRLINKPNGNAWGIEGGIEYTIMNTLGLNFNYTYMRKRAKDGATITNFPNHIANFRIKYNLILDLDLILGARYTTGRFTRVSVADYTTSPDAFLADIRVAYRIIKGLEVAIGKTM